MKRLMLLSGLVVFWLIPQQAQADTGPRGAYAPRLEASAAVTQASHQGKAPHVPRHVAPPHARPRLSPYKDNFHLQPKYYYGFHERYFIYMGYPAGSVGFRRWAW